MSNRGLENIIQSRGTVARSPAKLILSGEHAVVYGNPAIAMAVNCYAESAIRPHLLPKIFFNFLNLKYAKSFTLKTLHIFKERMQKQYHEFLEGNCGIKDVLKKPFELLQYTVTDLLENSHILLNQGVEIRSSSNIPIGCGMGSSAATVMSTLYALVHFFKLEFDPARILNLGKEAENLQHGRSSGLDLQLTLKGGCLKFQEGITEKRPFPNIPFTIVNTGMPLSTTGQCVSAVSNHFKSGTLKEDFRGITNAFDEALQQNHFEQMKFLIRENHKLLVKIGVVPLRVQEFIEALENEGAAAKICGAGSVMGDNAGVLLILNEEENHHIQKIVQDFGYVNQVVHEDPYGTRII